MFQELFAERERGTTEEPHEDMPCGGLEKMSKSDICEDTRRGKENAPGDPIKCGEEAVPGSPTKRAMVLCESEALKNGKGGA